MTVQTRTQSDTVYAVDSLKLWVIRNRGYFGTLFLLFPKEVSLLRIQALRKQNCIGLTWFDLLVRIPECVR